MQFQTLWQHLSSAAGCRQYGQSKSSSLALGCNMVLDSAYHSMPQALQQLQCLAFKLPSHLPAPQSVICKKRSRSEAQQVNTQPQRPATAIIHPCC